MRLNGRNELAAGSDDYPDDFEDGLFDEAAKEILQAGGYTPEMLSKGACSNLVRETFRVLGGGVVKGLGTEADPEMASALRENAFVFSGFKIHNELGEVTNAFKYMPELTDDKGNIRPFHEISKEVDSILADHKIRGINARYNQAYLRAEYNQAVQSAQMAAKYHDALSRKDYINLQYRTANDERVRSEHRKLHGVTLPVDDPFWNDYTPPLGWNCRCTIAEVLKDDYPVSDSTRATSTAERITSAPKDKIFRFNPAKEKRVFPIQHPYLPKGCGDCKFKKDINLGWTPNRLWCRACDAIRKCYQEQEKENAKNKKKPTVAEKQAVYSKPINKQFAKEGNILIHELRDKNAMDYERVTNAAKLLSSEGQVLVMPEIHKSEKSIRDRFGLTGNSNPDLKVGNDWVDVKSPFTIEALSDNACAAQRQNAIACITDDMCILKVEDMKDYAKKVFNSQGYHQDKVYFIVNGVLYKYNRQDLK